MHGPAGEASASTLVVHQRWYDYTRCIHRVEAAASMVVETKKATAQLEELHNDIISDSHAKVISRSPHINDYL